MPWLLEILWVLEGWKWDVFGGWPLLWFPYWYVWFATRAGSNSCSSSDSRQVVFCPPCFCLHVVARSWQCCVWIASGRSAFVLVLILIGVHAGQHVMGNCSP